MMPQVASIQRRTIVTALEVATQANVARSTVSRALRGDSSIRSETRKRVLSAAKALGYRVDERASRLRRLRAYCVSVILVCDQPEKLAEEMREGALLIPELHRLISALDCEMFVSVQNSEIRPDSFVQRLNADTSIIVGTAKSLDRRSSKILRTSPVKRFEFSSENFENWQTDFHSWIASAVISEQTDCEITIPADISRAF
jgi:DNA-binding LacI/PurR family transcriptional regulator